MAASTGQINDQLRNVRVGVRPDLDVSRHLFGDEVAYVVRDPISFQSHRLSTADYRVFTEISPSRTLGEVFRRLVSADIVAAEQEDSFYHFIVSLTQRGLLNLPLSDGSRLYKRFEERKRMTRKGWLLNTLFLRVPLVHPDRFLTRTVAFVQPLFTPNAAAIWVFGVLVCLGIVAIRWQEFTSPVASILAVHNIPLLWSLLVGLKVVHELGHAYACKRYGGQVPEMGAYFILLTPCAYVDASASWGFPSRLSRIIVALAGMYFESIVAMLAVVVWVATPSGTLHDTAHYAVVLSTIVTIAFNANPLMRYDGYYVVSDLTGIPNLRVQAERQLRQVLVRVMYGVRRPTSEIPRYRAIGLFFFGAAAAVYKVSLVLGLCVVLAHQLPLVGIGVALMYALGAIRQSVGTWIDYLRSAEELADRRRFATAVSLALVATGLLLVGFVPLPYHLETLAVIAPLNEVTIRAAVPGYVCKPRVRSGDRVAEGTLLLELENTDLTANVVRLTTATHASTVAWKNATVESPLTVTERQNELQHLTQDLLRAREDQKSLAVYAPETGVVVELVAERPGTFVRRGAPLVTIGAGQWTVRTILSAEQVVDAKVANGDEVQLRLFNDAKHQLRGRILHVSPAGRRKIDRTELTHLAGGLISVDSHSMETAEPMFEVTIVISDFGHSTVRAGSMAQVRFTASRYTLISCLYRRGLQLLHDLQLVG